MLVSVDSDMGTVTLYGKSVITVPITQINKIKALLAGKIVQYVREVMEVSGEEVLEMLSIMVEDDNYMPVAPSKSVSGDGMMWLYATGSGFMNIPEAKMRFDGPDKFKLLNQIGHDIFEKHPILQDLLNKGKIAICDTSEKNQILKRVAIRQEEQEQKMLLTWNGQSMIVDTSGGQMKKKGMEEDFDMITTDDPEEEFLNDQQKLMRQMGDLGKEADRREAEEAEDEGIEI